MQSSTRHISDGFRLSSIQDERGASALPWAFFHRRADAAAVNAIASGSQQRTMSAINQRMGPFAVGVGPEQLRDIPDGCRLGLDLPTLGAQGGMFGLEIGFSQCPDRRNARPSGETTGRWDVHRYG
jgi:hypothetical protein